LWPSFFINLCFSPFANWTMRYPRDWNRELMVCPLATYGDCHMKRSHCTFTNVPGLRNFTWAAILFCLSVARPRNTRDRVLYKLLPRHLTDRVLQLKTCPCSRQLSRRPFTFIKQLHANIFTYETRDILRY